MGRVAILPVMTDKTATDLTQVVNTSLLSSIMVVVVYTRVSGSGAGTLVFYGTPDSTATSTYLLGVKPVLTGTLDADAAISYTTSTTACYEIVGVHPYLNLQWTEDTNPASVTVYIVGWER